ncbi:hypothetical protein FKX85_06660 [Echinicola soli]|uniref:HNH nuclease domain-containing protein n=2 Tax=Echinicola soli TaxID=2591634 RepID=A0A514CFY6_9BACT|nr:hypothetical protein FKX85_06660 [Echinicola soli]
MQITGAKVKSMVDACHIIPFSQTQDDRITNGPALSPTMHRAFDQGLITVYENYHMVVTNAYDESTNADHGLKKLHERPILLPENKRHSPSQENLDWHRGEEFR